MIHLGSITEIDGSAIEPVDCITGGSPCQDLSVAGQRKGLAGERSGLFMEQIRVVKEMRNATINNIGLAQPRYMVWENVAGAFSSNGGKDFQAVLSEIVRIAEPEAPDVPMPKKDKWPHSGELHDEMGRWSVAWRTHDAQYWGVPQRRKRISILFDGGGLRQQKSCLSNILETNPDPKYNLSAKACQGILNRAQKRGKTLPPQLETALRRQSGGAR